MFLDRGFVDAASLSPDWIRLIDVELHTTGEHLDCDLRADRESINVADTPCWGVRRDAVRWAN